MRERFMRRHRQGTVGGNAAPELPGIGGGSAAPDQPAAGPQTETVHVIHGPLTMPFAVAGMTVAEAFTLLRGPLGLGEADGNIEVLVNGRVASGETSLERDSTLEFVHRSGEKGARG